MDEHAEFLWQSCAKEAQNGWASNFLRKDQVDATFPEGWAGVPTFTHVQPSGKLRRIDNAKRGMQNSTLRYVERMRMCTAFQPAAVAKAIVAESLRQGVSRHTLSERTLESGGEDIADAYRMLPVVLQDLPANVVMVKHPESGEVRFVIMSALLFGFSASVMQFARWSRFLEAMMRRVLCLLWAMYVDDSNVVDFADGKGSAQWLGRRVLLAIGVPLAEHKKVLMSPCSTFLGMLHDLGRALSQGVCTFTARDAVKEKLRQLISACAKQTTPAQASKIRGIAGFTALAMYGRIGRVAMGPLKQRQYTDKFPWDNSRALDYAYEFLLLLLGILIPREVSVMPHSDKVLLVATDSAPTGGAIIWDADCSWCGFTRFLPILPIWGYGPEASCIAECEGAMVPITLLACSQMFKHRRVLWLVDNTSSLHALVKGNSSNAVQARTVAIFRLLAFELRCQVYFEYVPSKLNFADDISRTLERSVWSEHATGQRPKEIQLKPMFPLWQLPLPELWRELELDGVMIVPMNLPDEMTSKRVSRVAELYASSPLRGFLCKQAPKVSFPCSTRSGDSEGVFVFGSGVGLERTLCVHLA